MANESTRGYWNKLIRDLNGKDRSKSRTKPKPRDDVVFSSDFGLMLVRKIENTQTEIVKHKKGEVSTNLRDYVGGIYENI